MQRRRFTGWAAFGLVGVMGLGASGCGTGPGSGDVTLKVVAADYGDPGKPSSSQHYWDEAVERFEKENDGIRVEVTVLSWNDVEGEVADMVKAGEAPDIAQVGGYADYAAEGRLYSVSELLSIPTHANLVPALARAGEVGRTQYGLPFASSTRVLFYNKKLFADAGLDPEKPPQTWKQLQKAAQALDAAGVKHPYGLPLGREEAQGESMMWMLGGGGGITDQVGTYTLDAPENVDTFIWLRDELVGKGLTGPGAPADLDRKDIFEAFGKGEVGMLNGHPTLVEPAKKAKIDYGTAPLPGKSEPAGSTMGVADWIMGFKENGHRKEIGAFLDFLFQDEQHYEFMDRYGLIPVTMSASDKMMDDSRNKELRPFLQALGEAEFYPLNKVSWPDVSQEIRKQVGAAVAEDGDPATVLGGLQRGAEEREAAAREASE
ncbi:extracellular solute-binding protein [Streptomyces sp. XM4193]|uniref:extracellular solute-binding protein n=1 Tax=Streptomyces sp. XM4193 TaxID=2929782 RepID=UPI001FFBF408|nr:extracellular solute-binding protein [Streptomyces sp. XM4193]MCK1795305.1 extracellular solute-binding protein [Streptomyces sp. XM4193]